MVNEDIIKMLESIEKHAFCDNTDRSYEYCMNSDCTECQIDYIKQQLKNGNDFMF